MRALWLADPCFASPPTGGAQPKLSIDRGCPSATVVNVEQFNEFFVSKPTRPAYSPVVHRPSSKPGFRPALLAADFIEDAGAANAVRGIDLSFENDKDLQRKRKSEPVSENRGASNSKKKKKGGNPAEVGNALRSIYQRTINEDIPPDLLDLLGKLG